MKRLKLNCGKNRTLMTKGFATVDVNYTSFEFMALTRHVFVTVIVCWITILCHTNSQAFTGSDSVLSTSPDNVYIMLESIELETQPDGGKKPTAENDYATTQAGMPVTVELLKNDSKANDEDDDDDDDDDEEEEENEIDSSSVDIDPTSPAVDKNINNSTGVFNEDGGGILTYTPAESFSGSTVISYTVKNKKGEISDVATVEILVTAEAEAPVITGQTPDPISIEENQPYTITLDNLIVSDADSNYPDGFSLAVSEGSNYSIAGSTVTPAGGYAGSLSVPVTVNDGTLNSDPFDLEIVVTAVNDPPVITGQSPDPLITQEDEAIAIVLSHLTVTDPDNTYPTGFTLQLSPGANYTISENSIIPAQNFNGTLIVPVTVNDGVNTSNVFDLEISVTAINDTPTITGQVNLSTGEEQPIVIELNDLTVTDPDNYYPTGFTLQIQSGTNYSVNVSTITPAQDFYGVLTVPVTVNDGQLTSAPFNLSITVNSSNDPPVITGQNALSVVEDNSLTIQLGDLQVSDSDNAYPADFILSLSEGTNYSLSGNTVIPDANFSGVLTVPARVNDGANFSDPFNLNIQVSPVNDAPIITGQQSLSTLENQGITVVTGNLLVTDPDNVYPNGFTLVVLPGNNYTVSGNTVTPAAGFSGTLQVGVTVNDGTATSAQFLLAVAVSAVNDPPVISGQQPLTFPEDNSFALLLSHLTVTDPDNTYPTGFTLTVLPGNNYSVSGNTITPTQNFSGTLTVNVIVNDGASDSNIFALSVTVTEVNDAPVIIGQEAISVMEDQSFSLSTSNLIVTDVDNSFPTDFTMIISGGSHYVVSGNSITPETNYTGNLSIPVQVNDGTANSNVFPLVVSVTPVNDVPVITGQTPIDIAEDNSFTIQLNHLSVVDEDNSYPSGFTLAVFPGANYSVLGTTITPAQDFNGTLNISVTVNDGANTSSPFNFQIQVGDANDPPTITGQTPLSTNEEQSVEITLNHLNVTDPDNSYPTGFSLLVSPGDNYTVSGNVVTPVLNYFGVLSIPVRVNDGINNSATFNFQLSVNPINDAPFFQAIPNQQAVENGAAGQVTISGISKGPGEEGQQLTFVASSGNAAVIPNPTVVYTGGSTATLQYTLVPNASGLVTINVTLIDNGATGSPHQNTFTSSFQINVAEVNQPPTVDAIANVVILEDAPTQTINVTGITAGPGESQTIVVQAVTNKPELFEIFQVVYTSPNASAQLQVKPLANQFGVATVTLSVIDNGSSISPSKNSIMKVFTITIQPVNDAPVFVATPSPLAVVGEQYNSESKVSDLENGQLVIGASAKPPWLLVTNLGGGAARLSGTPGPADAGTANVILLVQDGELIVYEEFSILVNRRPTVSNFQISTTEDVSISVGNLFPQYYSDEDNHGLTSVLITQSPSYGTLKVGEEVFDLNDTVPASSVSSLVYVPIENYFGVDAFRWKASDGYHYSSNAALTEITITPVNDSPSIILETDTLLYEVNGEPSSFTTLLEIQDPDSDSLVSAEVGFQPQNFYPEYDIFSVGNSQNIRAFYDFTVGKISLNGKAPIREYVDLIKSIQYTHANTIDPALDMKRIYVTVNDGNSSSEVKDRLIQLQYTFIELEIPTGFTPNGDQVNDLWIISRPNGVDQLIKAEVKVFNKRGEQVFRREGFSDPWDGTFDGKPLPADTYFYTIDLHLRNKKTYKGIITLLR